MKWIKTSERFPEKKVFAKLHGEIGLLHTVNKDSMIFDCGGQGWRYDMTDRTVKEFEWLEESEPTTSVTNNDLKEVLKDLAMAFYNQLGSAWCSKEVEKINQLK